MRGALASLFVGLLAVAGALVPATSAGAMTQVGAPPQGVAGSSVVAFVQNQGAGFGTWSITAPPNTTITAAQSREGVGLSPFTCTVVAGGQGADCGTANWGVGNQVTITMTITPGTAPGTYSGTSGISGVGADAPVPYAITVVLLAAPNVTTPAQGSESITPPTALSGSKAAGTGVTVSLDGVVVGSAPADAGTTWSVPVAGPPGVGTHTVTVVETDPHGNTASARSTFTVLAAAGLTVTQSGGSPLYAGAPTGRTVTVANAGEGEARDVALTVDTGGLQVTACVLDDVPTDCSALPTGVALGTVAPGAERVLRLTVVAAEGTAPGTAFTVAARASSTTAAVTPVESASTLTVDELTTPVFTRPADGSSTVARRLGVRGEGVLPGAVVSVRQGDTVLCTATGMVTTGFSCTPDRTFPLGPVTLTATQAFGGNESAVGSVRFTVVAPAQPGGSTQPPPTGGGSGGGSGGAPGQGGGGGTGSGTVPGSGTTPGGSAPGSGGPGAGEGTGTGTGTGGVAPGAGATGGGTNGGAGATAPGATGGGSDDADGGSGSGSGSTGGSAGSDDAGGTGGDGSGDGPLGVDLRFGTQRIVPGTAADMRGTLGPNESGATVVIDFQARVTRGMVYRSVDVRVGNTPSDCAVATSSFSCQVVLDDGDSADVAVRVFADAVNAPDTAVQQISIASNRASQANAMTVTTAVAKGRTEASELADQITTFNVTEFPGAMVPLLAMLLFALAASVAGRRPATGSPAVPAADPATPPPGPDVSGPGRASSPTTEPPSGSNR